MIQSAICEMLGIQYPVFQGGMAWIADGKLAAAVSNGGGLGIIAAGNAPGEYFFIDIPPALCRLLGLCLQVNLKLLQRDILLDCLLHFRLDMLFAYPVEVLNKFRRLP